MDLKVSAVMRRWVRSKSPRKVSKQDPKGQQTLRERSCAYIVTTVTKWGILPKSVVLLKRKKMTVRVWKKAVVSEQDVVATGHGRYRN